jgi:hypothetical protein
MFWKVPSDRLSKYLRAYHRRDDSVNHMCGGALGDLLLLQLN